MRTAIVVRLMMLLVTTMMGTVSDSAFEPLSDPYIDDEEEAVDRTDRKVSECFGKLRASCNLNPEFSAAIDRFARTLRVDKLREIIEWKVQAICNEGEREATIALLREELMQSAAIVKETVHNLTDFDRDRLNMWANLNDTISERNFFLEKYRPTDTETLTNSLNSLISRIVNGEPPQCVNQLIGLITAEDLEELSSPVPTIYENATNKLLNKMKTSSELDDLRLFISGTWRHPIPV